MTEQTSIHNERPSPHNPDVERAILASVLRSGDVNRVHDNRVDAETFYSHIHREVFTAMLQVQKTKLHIDLITVCHQLSKNSVLEDIGGEVFIAELYNMIATDAELESWIKIHLDFHAKRLLINKCSETLLMCYDEKPTALETFNAHRGGLGEVEGFSCGKVQTSTIDKLKGFTSYLGELQTGAGGHVVKFGISGIDQIMQLQVGQLMTLGGLSNTGKTRFILCDAIGKMRKGIASAIFSWENTTNVIIIGMVSIMTGIPMGVMTDQGKLQDKHMKLITVAMEFLKKHNHLLYVFGKGDYIHSVSGISAELRRIQDNTSGAVKMCFIDHLQNLKADPNESRSTQLESTVYRIGEINSEHKLAVILLSQINRDKTRDVGGRKPILADLRGSGAIEDASDYVVFLHREDRRAIGNVPMDFYTCKVRGTGMFDKKLNFNTHSGLFSGIVPDDPRYTKKDQPVEHWYNKNQRRTQ